MALFSGPNNTITTSDDVTKMAGQEFLNQEFLRLTAKNRDDPVNMYGQEFLKLDFFRMMARPDTVDGFYDTVRQITDSFGGDLSAGDVSELLDQIADALGRMEIDADDPALARKLNEIEGMARDMLVDGDPSLKDLDALADAIGSLANDVDDPKLAQKLNALEGKLRDAMSSVIDAKLDEVADALGQMEIDAEDPQMAKKLNELEGAVRELMGGGADAESIDRVADQIGEVALDADPDTAQKLNALEGKLRDMLDGYSSSAGGLTVEGDTVDTGRYEITAKDGELKIFDKETNTHVRAWGDPHLHTGDGDKAQFHEDNLTIDLRDGTKVTIVPTEKNSRGDAYIDRVAITRNDDAVIMTGFHDGEKGVSNTGVMDRAGIADSVDLNFDDGTVLRAGDEVDDLYFTDSSGRRAEEIKGTDPSQRHNEHMLDGRGGASLFGAEGVGRRYDRDDS